MPKFTIMPTADFEQKYPDIHQQVCSELGLGFVPNIFRCIVNTNPELAMSSWQMVRNNLCQGIVPRAVKELIFSYIAYKRKCDYCHIAHHALALIYGFEHHQINAFFDDIEHIDNPTLSAALYFADQATETTFSKPLSSYHKLEKLGFEDRELIELLGMISCALYMINIADGLAIPVDQRFIDVIHSERA